MGSRRRRAPEQDPAPRRAVLQRSEEPGNGVLELQRSAGNRAVTERIEVARDKTGDGGPNAKTDKTLKLDGLSKPMAIMSYSLPTKGNAQTGTGGGNDRENGAAEIHEVNITAKLDDLGVEVQRASVAGKSLGNGELDTGYMILHMTDVYVSSAQIGGSGADQTITFTLNFGSVEFHDPGMSDKSSGTPDSAQYDLTSPAGA